MKKMEFKRHLQKYLTDQQIDALIDSFNDEDKHAVLLNLDKMDDQTFLSHFPNVTPHPVVAHAYIYNKCIYDLGKSIYHLQGCFYLQEPSAMLVSFLLNPKPHDYVLDLCAAPGGKTIQASMLMKNQGLLYSNDISYKRSQIITQNVERLGLSNVIVTCNDYEKIYKDYLNYFDKIILDAPCSGSGMFRKDDKMRDDWSINKVLKFQEIQKQLITYAYEMLKPGGTLIYSTCSYSYEEDEEVVQYLLDNSDAIIEEIPSNNLYFTDPKTRLGIHLFPNKFPGEGHYICKINKPGNLEMTVVKPSMKVDPIVTKIVKLMKMDLNFLEIKNFNNFVFLLPVTPKSVKGLNIVRYGVKAGEIINDTFKYDYHLSRVIKKFIYEINIDEETMKKFLLGNTINEKINKGYVLIKYQNNPIAFGKSDGQIIKNLFPKGLRVKVN